ncbi:hypothetical protein BCR44DRAFT_1392666 [Catenaria anguillulae PL171]|uniref:RING-type E3 ubiquitin transferase n=1 Tax=Catenaria anguillulae PL171 TaxID=765915 RepID=A0A1Y2H9U1_9FUNG|nr:hypothetical protein BCR44DRAFT_1392666 [Catenaria anguillulae PL171]
MTTEQPTQPIHFPFATPPDMIRAAQKDDAYTHTVLAALQSVLAATLSPSTYASIDKFIPAAASALYLVFTTGRGAATLGEEYCDLAPVAANGHSPAKRWQRVLFVLAQVLSPPAFLAALKRMPDTVRQRVPWIVNQVVVPAHLAVFYFTGAYYHLARRIAGIRSMAISKPSPDRLSFSYAPLGYMLLGKVAVTVAMAAYQAATLERLSAQTVSESTTSNLALTEPKLKEPLLNEENEDTHGYDPDTSGDCVLCMGPRVVSTVAPCGHIFCWSCVGEWVLEKPECPLCRSPCAMRDLLCVDY